MYIDTHCHLQKEFYDDIGSVIQNNRAAGVSKIIVSGCTISEIKEVLNYAIEYEDVYLTIGFHPEVASEITLKDLKWLKELIINNDRIVGIGEIGLDYHYEGYNKAQQQYIFEKQLQIAEELDLPVVIHSRDATQDTIKMLKKFSLKGDIHCFSGSYETAQIYIKMGYLLGIGGVITFKNSKLRDIIKNIDLHSILLETDSPYLTPEPYRGQLNSSKHLPLIASEIAKSLELPLTQVAEITTKNALDLFNIK